MKLIPNKLKIGDELRVIAPSSSFEIIDKENVNYAKKALEHLGIKVSFGKNLKECDMMGSSSIDSRLEDFHQAFSDKNVRAILTVIGGFNSNQLLSHIDYDLIRINPKIFCGFSDITALQNAILSKSGLVTYSGPHFSTFAMQKGFEYTLQHFKKMLFEQNTIEILPSNLWSDDAWFLEQSNRNFEVNDGYWSMNDGTGKGKIVGGSLSTFQLLHGTLT